MPIQHTQQQNSPLLLQNVSTLFGVITLWIRHNSAETCESDKRIF